MSWSGALDISCHPRCNSVCLSVSERGEGLVRGRRGTGRAAAYIQPRNLALTYISGNSLGNLTPRSTFSVWKFPWKYDLLWRQKLQETGISNRFPAVSFVSGAFHPISRAEKSPRPLIFSHLPLFAISFLGKSLNTNIAATECYLGRVWANFT